jgi:hypothetical protein
MPIIKDSPKARAKRRAAAARNLEKRLNTIWSNLAKIPSYTGKAPFMDKVKAAHTRAHNLAWELERDLEMIARKVVS